jgi:hypothetical protein
MRYDEDEEVNKRDEVKRNKARIKVLEAALRDIANRTNPNENGDFVLLVGSEARQVHLIAIKALGE